jgi:hypothetical protein
MKESLASSFSEKFTTEMNKIILLAALFACAYGKNLFLLNPLISHTILVQTI